MEKLKEKLVNILSYDPDDEEFHKAVGEIGVNEYTVEYPTKEFFDMNELVQLFEKACTARALAETIEKHTLRDIAENIMQFVHFVAKHVHKQSFRYSLGLDDIFDALYTHLHDIRAFALRVGEKEQGIYQERRFIATVDWYTQIAKDAQKGDSEALEYLALSEVPDLPINKLNHCPNYLSLSATFSAMIEVGMIAKFMEDTVTTSLVEDGLALIQLMQNTFNKKDISDLVDGMDVLQGLKNELELLQNFIHRLEKTRMQHLVEKKREESEDDSVQEEQDPTYDPDRDDEDSLSSLPESHISPSDSEERHSKKRRPETSSHVTASKGKKQVQTAASAAPKKKRKGSELRSRSNETPPDGDACPPHSTSSTASLVFEPPQKKKDKEDTRKKRSHHKTRKCPICHKTFKDLKPHLKVHASRGRIDKQDVEKFFVIADKGRRKRGHPRGKTSSQKGLPLKWCPVEGCTTVVTYMRNHLKVVHKMKSRSLLDLHVKLARRYKGRKELHDIKIYTSSDSDDEIPSPASHPQPSSTKPGPSGVKPSSPQAPPRKTPSADPRQSAMTPSPPPEDSGTIVDRDFTSGEPSGDDDHDDDDDDDDGDGKSDPDYDEPQMHFFTAKHPRSNRHKWLVEFYNYLNLPAAGRKKNRNRLQHASHIRTLLEDLEPHGNDITILAKDNGNVVWNDWVDPKMDSLTTGTINSYLGTYQKFLDFVLEERQEDEGFPPLDKHTLRIFRNVKPKLKGWRSTVDNELRPERTTKILHDYDIRLSNDDVKAFRLSKVVSEAEEIFKTAASGTLLSLNEVCEARDYLITLITLKTGTRPGALENATLTHYKQRATDDQTGNSVLLIPRHKRQKDGPAMITLDEKLAGLMEIYVNAIHPLYPAPRGEELFLQKNGTPFKESKLAKRLPAFWAKSGVRSDIRVTATNIRKFIVTQCHTQKMNGEDVDEDLLRQAMCHSDQVARTHYLRMDKTAVAARATNIIARCTADSDYKDVQQPSIDHSQKPSKPDEQKEQHKTTGYAQESSKDPTQQVMQLAVEPQDPSQVNQTAVIFSEEEPPQQEAPQQPSHHAIQNPDVSSLLTTTQKNAISEVFAKEITDKKPVMLAVVRDRMKTHPTLRALVPHPDKVKKVTDHLRYRQASQPNVQPQELELETSSAKVSRWLFSESPTLETGTTSSPGREEWTSEDHAEIKNRFYHLDKCPCKPDLLLAFQESIALKDIFRRKGYDKCRNKIRNMLRKK